MHKSLGEGPGFSRAVSIRVPGHPEAAESSAKPRTPNEGSLHSAGSTMNEGCTFASAFSSTLSSRAEKDRPLDGECGCD
jgi:hypothetical protein